jgi:hypothetical protein
MGKFKDASGKRYGRLTVIEVTKPKFLPCGQRETQYLCKCDCGTEKIISYHDMSRGRTSSCGCLRKEGPHTTHGKTHDRIYRIYNAMKTRCYNHNFPRYADYGGRGIRVCDEWLNDFQRFYNWAIENGYAPNLSIDRINNEKGYSPGNCRWATAKEQNNNQRLRKDSRKPLHSTI